MKIRNLEFNNQLDRCKINQINKYKYFDIPKDVFEKSFDEAVKKEKEENEIVSEHDKLIQKYIVNEINNGNTILLDKVISYFSPIKTIIVKNKRYNLEKDMINSIYIKAIKLLKYIYNEDNSININILNNMKYIINNNYIDTPINKMDIRIYDITFLKKYMKNLNLDHNKFANEIEISNKELSSLLNGLTKASIDLMETLCIYFDVENYDKLKDKIENEINNKKINVEEIREKLKEEPKKEKQKEFIIKKDEKCYNLSFMKEYVQLYNIRKDSIAQLFNCGINKVDDILDGKLWIKESLMSELYIEFRVKGFIEFKAKILSKIKFNKLNLLKNKLKIFNDKYLKNKNKSLIDIIDKDVLSQVLELDSMDIIDKNITKLLFKIGFNENYTYDDISMILDIDKERIEKVHKEDLQKINSMLDEVNNVKVLKK